jgi:hypothetical protein
MRQHFIFRRVAWLWHQHVGSRCLRFEFWLVAWYHARAVAPWQLWRAAGCPVQFRPVFRWWLVPLGLVLAFFGFWPVPPGRPVRRAGVSVRARQFERLAELERRAVRGTLSAEQEQELSVRVARAERGSSWF